jgi:hypothetical protein
MFNETFLVEIRNVTEEDTIHNITEKSRSEKLIMLNSTSGEEPLLDVEVMNITNKDKMHLRSNKLVVEENLSDESPTTTEEPWIELNIFRRPAYPNGTLLT